MNGRRPKIPRPPLDPETESFCTHCRNVKPREAFPKNKNSANGLHAWCLACNNAGAVRWENASPENYRRRRDQQALCARRYHVITRGTPLAEGPVKARYTEPARMRETATA